VWCLGHIERKTYLSFFHGRRKRRLKDHQYSHLRQTAMSRRRGSSCHSAVYLIANLVKCACLASATPIGDIVRVVCMINIYLSLVVTAWFYNVCSSLYLVPTNCAIFIPLKPIVRHNKSSIGQFLHQIDSTLPNSLLKP
jgi:hypothetical protein